MFRRLFYDIAVFSVCSIAESYKHTMSNANIENEEEGDSPNEADQYVVEKVINKRKVKGKIEYFIKW